MRIRTSDRATTGIDMKLRERATEAMKRRPVVTSVGALVAGGVAAYLFFAVFGFHLIFVDEVVEEADPFAAAADASGLEDDPMVDEPSP
ncbi:MAG: hypothetical protein R3320_07595, partial [Nitriliruptorales bacterium]|nr:hypothetical protein [Nitriliruptorales bacterium]